MNETVVSERTEVRRSGCDVNRTATQRGECFHDHIVRGASFICDQDIQVGEGWGKR